jgi:hypothetical protein
MLTAEGGDVPRKKLKVLGVHGLGDHRNSTWKDDWKATLLAVFPGQTEIDLQFAFLTYDPIFERVDISTWETMQAVWKLGRSGVANTLGQRRDVAGELSDRLKWTAGYVVAWVEDDGFKQQTRKLVLDSVAAEKPDVILAHSLGSLITYDAFAHRDARRPAVAAALRNARYVTLGSQLGNPFVAGNVASGRLMPLPVSQWFHLYNQEDDVFTAPIKLWDSPTFRQVDAHFDVPGGADHSAVEYLRHTNTIEGVWRPLAEQTINRRAFGATRAVARKRRPAGRIPDRKRRRALLVGINQYPQEQDRLEGCVNDVYLMSAVLQECGFPAGSIRVCLDERATSAGITDRLKWLLDDPRDGDERVFYYSGHGARIADYGERMEPDRQMETLVPWDFDWSPERAIVDDQIFSLYSQLPYNTRFAMILDCCHSGGLHRQGNSKVRGLNPPDDIRHRELRWDKRAGMWVPRDFNPLNRRFSSKAAVNLAFFGEEGQTTRIGRANLLRTQSEREYRRAKQRTKSTVLGPYLPLIIEACREKEFSYEYRHGVTSFGAFTYALCLELRRSRQITFKRLVETTAAKLAELGYKQRPQILGPAAIVNAVVPWSE